MLTQYLSTLSNAAQLKIAIRLSKLALPVWYNYFNQNTRKISEVNSLVPNEKRIPGAYKQIEIDFPGKALHELEIAFESVKHHERPAAVMKEHAKLTPLLFTFMGPITNKEWDYTLPRNVRLVYTSIWNILTWLLHHEKNDDGETHISVAINQAADALNREGLMNYDDINIILGEYAPEKRFSDEDSSGAIQYDQTTNHSIDANEVYQKIIGPTPVKDPPSVNQAREIVRQMRDEKKHFWDSWEEYYSGTNISYSYDTKENKFKRSDIDIIAGAFSNTYWLSDSEMIQAMQKYSIFEFRKSGFNI